MVQSTSETRLILRCRKFIEFLSYDLDPKKEVTLKEYLVYGGCFRALVYFLFLSLRSIFYLLIRHTQDHMVLEFS